MTDRGIQKFCPLQRIRGIQEKLGAIAVDAVLLNYSKSVYYYTGTAQPSFLILSPQDFHLLISKGIEHVPQETWISAERISPGGLDGITDILKKWGISGGVLGMELDVIPAVLYFRVARMLPQFKIVDISKIVLE